MKHVPARARCVWSKSEATGKLVLSDLIGAGSRYTVDVRQDHIVPNLPRLANMAWTLST